MYAPGGYGAVYNPYSGYGYGGYAPPGGYVPVAYSYGGGSGQYGADRGVYNNDEE